MAIGRPLSIASGQVASKNISFTATGGQTVFNIPGGYNVNQVHVYRNGARLNEPEDFTAKDSSNITLLSAALAGDIVDVQIFSVFSAADAINTTGNQNIDGSLSVSGGINVGIQSAGDNITTGVITAINFIGAGNTIAYNSGTKTVDVSIAGGGAGGGGIGTAISYPVAETATPFSFISASTQVTENLLLDTTLAGANNTYIVSVIPSITVNSGVAMTVGTGKTMVIDVLKIGDL
tara:strand:- start:8509 stop:9213 length:705 start_codon:yes stop_codon:yes gene_type:complete